MTDLTEITMQAETQDLVQKTLQLQEQLDFERSIVANANKTIENQKDVIAHLQSQIESIKAKALAISAERDAIVNLIKSVSAHLISK